MSGLITYGSLEGQGFLVLVPLEQTLTKAGSGLKTVVHDIYSCLTNEICMGDTYPNGMAMKGNTC